MKIYMQQFDIGLTAHDSKKEELVHLVRTYREALEGCSLAATKNTGRMIQHSTGLSVVQMHSGLLGGYQQLGTLIVNEKVKTVIFLQDPLIVHPDEQDIMALNRVCNAYNIPFATNKATAEAVLHLFFERRAAFLTDKRLPVLNCDLIGVHP
jgi:methylglyoxal synthase